MSEVELHRVGPDGPLTDAFDVRRAVFVRGQNVEESLELDGKDTAARHVVAYLDGHPIGTGRVRAPQPGVAKIERVAVRASHREQGIGQLLVEELEAMARQAGQTDAVLHAQTRVEGFYDRLGYQTVSDVFEEAGIPHVKMTKSLELD